MFDTMKTAQEIREARIARNMTQMNLADEMGVSYQAVSNWERGNSMPDIGKLNELCRILGLSLERLLGAGRQTENVQKVICYTEGKAEAPSLEEVCDAAPLMKPEEVEKCVGKAEDAAERSIDLSELVRIAPFMSKEALGRIAEKAVAENGGDLNELTGIAPFMSREALARMVEKAVAENGGDLNELTGIAPFLSKEVLGRIAEKAVAENGGSLNKLTGMAPFLGREDLARMAEKAMAENGGSLSELTGIAPFLGREDLARIAEKAVAENGGSLSELVGIAPYLGNVDRIVRIG